MREVTLRVRWLQGAVTLSLATKTHYLVADLTLEEAGELRGELDHAIKMAATPPIPCVRALIESLR